MKALTPGITLDGFFGTLRAAPRRVLLLDYDGTLAPFVVDPSEAFPYPGVRDAVGRVLRRRDGRVVVISGRRAADLVPLLGLDPRPEIWGSHGIERLAGDGTYEVAQIGGEAERGLADARAWLVAAGLAVRGEEKPGCVAVHWRGEPEEEQRRLMDRVRTSWSPVAERSGLLLAPFDGGYELRSPLGDKGDVVRRLLAEEGPGPALAYLGDDLTDEDAFAALAGRGLRVLVRREFRETAADLWIQPPEELLLFLRRWAED